MRRFHFLLGRSFLALSAAVLLAPFARAAEPAHPNPTGEIAERPHTYLPLQAFAEADRASRLFQYYLLDSDHFEPNVFTHLFPGRLDHFPDAQTNVLPLHESMGAYNAVQQSDVHAYWEFNYQGDNPNPRDPDRFDGDVDAQREFRERGVPSGLADEVYLDTYARIASFEPGVPFPQRRFDAYAAEVARVDQDGNGVISAVEGDPDSASDGFPDNARLYLSPTEFNRFAVTREINDGLLAPRFAPSQRAWVLSGVRVGVKPAVSASFGRDGDDR